MYKTCIKCGANKESTADCPYCGVIYAKAERAHQDKLQQMADGLRAEQAEDDFSPDKTACKDDDLNKENPQIFQHWASGEEVNVNSCLQIAYRDSSGETTNRKIHVTWYSGSCYMDAFCDLRQRRRTFRIDRIQACVDIETGEVVNNVPDYLLKKYQSTPEYQECPVKNLHVVSPSF